MITKHTIIRTNPAYKVWTTEEYVEKHPEYQNELSSNISSFFLVHENYNHPRNAIILDLKTVNCLFSFEKPSKISSQTPFDLSLIKSLIFDHVLQIQNYDGTYVSGPSLLENNTIKKNNTPTQVSMNAIKHAWFYKHEPIEEIVEKLYTYGTMPTNFELLNLLNTPENLINWLKVNQINSFSEYYNFIPISEENKYWLYWQRKNVVKTEELPYKLYISPIPRDLPFVFKKVVETCIKLSAPIFKLGSTSRGIHRPDKMVLYFKSMDEINSFTKILKPMIEKKKGQVIPFTYSLTKNGILSYGIEPDVDDKTSFRIHISKLIAKTIKLYSFQNTSLKVDDILVKLDINGIQTNKWNLLC